MNGAITALAIRPCSICRKRTRVDPIAVNNPGVTCRPCGARLLDEEARMDHEASRRIT